jgi:hypothetical protein
MKNWKNLKTILPLAAMMLLGQGAFGQSQALPTNSAPSLPKPDTSVSSPHPSKGSAPDRAVAYGRADETNLVDACMAAIEDLKATRGLVEALETENTALKKHFEAIKQSADLLNELNMTRKSETESLHATVAAKNEVIAAKDAVIVSQDKLIETLKKKKSSPWTRLGDLLIGAALFAILK